MNLSISNIAWTTENDNEMYKFISDNGFGGLEIAPTRLIPENPYNDLILAKDIVKNIKQNFNLDVCSMQSILFGKTERLFASDEERLELLNYTKKAINFANAINCHNLVFGSPKNRVIENNDQYPLAINFFRELGEYALLKNTTLSIEANPPIYNTNFINTTDQAFQLVKDVDSRGFMVNVDFGTIIQNNEDINLIVESIDYVNHIHISEPNLTVIEHRDIHRIFADKLNKTLYDKFISIEMKNTDNINITKSVIMYIKQIFK